MHELSICAALLDQVESLARHHGAPRVCRIEVAVGPLSGVEPQLLQQAFTIARSGSCAEAAELILTTSGVRVRCETCSKESDAAPNQLRCSHCRDWRTRVIAGDELLLSRVELETHEETTHV